MDSVTICNFALTMLGMPCVASFEDEGDNNARMLKQFYPVLRDRVLRDHTWSFATRYCQLTAIEESPLDPCFEYACPLPEDCIRVVKMTDDSSFRRCGNLIFCNSPDPQIEYISRVVDPNEFDPNFIEALQYCIAAELGMANTRDANLINMYRQEYQQRLAVARAIDSQENYYNNQRSRPKRSNWIASRGSKGV